MSYFASALDLVVEMLQVVIIYSIGPKYIPGYFRGYAVHPYFKKPHEKLLVVP